MKFLGKAASTLFCALAIFSIQHQALAKQKTSSATPIYGSQSLAYELDRIVHSVDPNAAIGVQVKSMKNGENLYSYNEYHAFVPASILKVVTAQTALLFLGPEYKFSTRLVTDASSIENGVINGNIYLVHSGDPTLTFSDMTDLMDTLKSQHIQTINGNVFVDTSAYDQAVYGPGWMWDDKKFCYSAPISASIINHNCLSFNIAPGKANGQLANIIPSPRYYYSSIQNSVVTKASRSCYISLTNNADSSISVSGCIGKGQGTQGVSTVINEVVEYNKYMLRDLFHRNNIRITGVISAKAAPSAPTVIATHESKPLYELVSEMLKMSDNIIAGSLFKKIGATYYHQQGTWENGSSAVMQILSQKMGLSTARMSVLDGSGLSRYNQISPMQMIQILDYAYHHGGTNYEFVSALPIAGIDGTLKHRLQNIAWKVRAKTGTMAKTGVVALAGYAISKDKEPLAFVIIVNGRNGAGWKYKEAEDKIVQALTKYTRV